MTATANTTETVATAKTEDDKQRAILVKVTPELHRGVKVLAALSDQTVTDLVTDLLATAVAESGADKVKLPGKASK